MKENRIVYTEFGTAGFPDPCLNIFSRAMSTFLTRLKFTDNANVNWVRSGDQFYTITETPLIQKIDPVTLEKEETVGSLRLTLRQSCQPVQFSKQKGFFFYVCAIFNCKMPILSCKVSYKHLTSPIWGCSLVYRTHQSWRNHAYSTSDP